WSENPLSRISACERDDHRGPPAALTGIPAGHGRPSGLDTPGPSPRWEERSRPAAEQRPSGGAPAPAADHARRAVEDNKTGLTRKRISPVETVETRGIEPLTPALQRRCSAN